VLAKTDRRNRYGRRGGRNRCGHDPRAPIRPDFKAGLPGVITLALWKIRRMQLPLLLGCFNRRSELEESVPAVLTVMAARADVVSYRVGTPGRRWFMGISVDEIARLSEISESRVERAISTLYTWGWLHFTPTKDRRRHPCKLGFRRRPAQYTERKGQRVVGFAAVRRFTHEFWTWLGLGPQMIAEGAKRTAAADAAANGTAPRQAIPPAVVGALVSALAGPSDRSDPRARPPPGRRA
jgi:hypothetical protein